MYGIAVAALGMLSTIAIGLAIDAYGPISDNAGGIAEMAGMSHRTRERTDALNAVGNTTAAIGKMGGIDEAALDRLSLVTEMSKQIRVKASRERSTTSEIGQLCNMFIYIYIEK